MLSTVSESLQSSSLFVYDNHMCELGLYLFYKSENQGQRSR